MHAVTFAEYGGPEVLQPTEVDTPEPGPGQVRVAVRAAGVNPFDWKLRSGAMADSVPVTLPHIPGVEVAGVVDKVGDGADFAVGDAVFGWSTTGSYAQYALATVVARRPAELALLDAAGLPVAGETALRGLRELRVTAGETLLVHGASGAVGSLAVQLAVAAGATVIGTASEANLDRVRALGATAVPHGAGLVERVRAVAPHGVDAAFDTAGHGALPDSVELAGGKDRVLTIADPAAFAMGITFTSGGGQTSEILTELAEAVVAGRLRLRHAGSYPLDQAAEAHRRSESGHPDGKLTLTVTQ